MGYLLFYEKHHFGLRNGLFRNSGIRNPQCGTYGMRQ